VPESKNTPADNQRAAKAVEMKQLIGKLEPHILEVLAMMRSRIPDGLGAARYGQFGGSFPDPTAGAVFDVHGDEEKAVRWRDGAPERDLAEFEAAIDTAHKALLKADEKRRANMSANNNIRDRLDPTDFCSVHWHLQVYKGHRRFKGPLCKICAGFYDENGREPTPTEADHYHRHGRWPHKRYDPKERRAV
jgi:hypothetical protein